MARALLPLDEEADQIAMCQRIESEKLSVRQTEDHVRRSNTTRDTIPFLKRVSPGQIDVRPLSNHIARMQQQLRELLGTKVEIRLKGKESGQV